MPASMNDTPGMRVLVLGAYGLIGSAIARTLVLEGYEVTGVGRSLKTAQAVLPTLNWEIHDLVDLQDETAWLPLLCDQDFVVNCAGVLQQSYRDDLDAVHNEAVKALSAACATSKTALIQISAVGADEAATTSFMKTKASGDSAIRQAGIDYWIFRPGMVLAPTAYGGSALLRMLAAVPLIQPLACPYAKIQTVSLSDVCRAVLLAVKGDIPAGTEVDLVEDTPNELRHIIARQRRWLGFGVAKREINMPGWMLSMAGRGADILGRLGWRSPLRSSALNVLQNGVLGDARQWQKLGLPKISSLSETLAGMSATTEDRLSARMALLMPLAILVLFVFWFASGVVGLLQVNLAAQVLEHVGWPSALAKASVIFWSFVDIGIAAALLLRKFAQKACIAMVVVSLFYILSATVTVPHLWLDPLGPLVKVLPGVILAMITHSLLEPR
ncbi:MAG: SDR family oxidoreductase [Stappiaceae bacterium]